MQGFGADPYDQHVPVHEDVAPWDGVVERLQTLRRSAGNPSYEVIAQRISSRREGAGLSPHAARVARSTVYDSLRPGRTRLSVEFLYEIADVLGGSRDQVDRWVGDSHTGTASDDHRIAKRREIALLLVACVALNIAGRLIVDALHLPIYLDMVGTALAAVALGPWLGALVGGVTNVVSVVLSGWVSLPFALVNVAGALVWGYGIRRFGMGRTLARFFSLNLIVALVCSVVAVPILVFMFGGSVEQGQDSITQTFLDFGNGLLVAVGFSNVLTSGIDKLVSGFVALVIITALPWHLRRGIPLVMADQRP